MLHVQIGDLIKEKDDFAIVSHTSPDGDSMGSMLGLYNALKEWGKTASMFSDDVLPNRYSFLPSFEKINETVEFSEYSCLFVLDCGDPERLGRCRELFSRAETIINIDHHISNTLFGNINIVDSNASSAGELIYEILKLNGFEISRRVAECLYTSILTDTGGFKYSNTTSMTFSIAGDLINTGIDFTEINSLVYDRKSVEQVKLMSMVVPTLELYFNNTVASLIMRKDMLVKSCAEEEEASEFINIARDIDGVEVAVFIKEKDTICHRISLRSKKYVDVRKIAEVFGGGGHIRAAGCTIEGTIEEVKNKLISEIEKALVKVK